MAANTEILILDTEVTDNRSSVQPARRKWRVGTLVRHMVDEAGGEWFDLLTDHHQSSYRKAGERGDAIFAKVKASARPLRPEDEQTAKVRIQRLAFRLSECGQFNCAPLLLALVDAGPLHPHDLERAILALEESSDDEASVYRTVRNAFNPSY